MLTNLPLKGYIYASYAINVATILAIIFVRGLLPPVVPLFYGLPVGAGELVPYYGLVIAPLVSLLVTSINVVLSLKISDTFLKKTLLMSSFFVAVLTSVTVIKIIFLVGFW